MTICPFVDMLVISIFKAGPFLVGTTYAINIRAGGWVSKFFWAVCPARRRWRGEDTSRQKRLRAPEGWNLAKASGTPQAAPPPDGCVSQGGSEGLPPQIPVPRGGSAARSACPNPPQNGPFSSVADPEAPFVPILPQDVAAYIPAAKIFRSLGSKTDPILHIQFTRLWGIVALNRGKNKWRPVWKDIRSAALGPQ